MGDRPVKIFIASSAELKDEREKCVLLINALGKSHKHLRLEPVEWEYDLVHANYPGHETIQDAIHPLLKDAQLAVFFFHSRIGQYTRQEFAFATKENKRLFAFFKTGFSPAKSSLAAYGELLDFKEALTDTVLYKEYVDLTDFEKLFYPNLNLYLAETYPKRADEERPDATVALSQGNLALIRMLDEKEREIKTLRQKLDERQNEEPDNALQTLLQEKETIQCQLLQSEEIIRQQAKEKEALEQQLSPQKEKDGLKAKALEEVERGNYAEAEEYLRESARESISDAAATFYELAKIKKLRLQYAEAFRFYELAVKINPENSLHLNDAGVMAHELGYADKAIGYYERSLEVERKENDEEHPNVAIRYNNLGEAYRSKGEYDNAIGYYEKALTFGKQFYGEEHPDLAVRYNNLGLAYHNKGEYSKAIGYYEKALVLDKQFYGEKHPQIAIYENNLGEAYRSKGEYDNAIGYYEKALLTLKKIYGEEHPDIATGYNNLGLAHFRKGAYDEAAGYCEKALTIFRKFIHPNHPHIQNVQNNLATMKDLRKKDNG